MGPAEGAVVPIAPAWLRTCSPIEALLINSSHTIPNTVRSNRHRFIWKAATDGVARRAAGPPGRLLPLFEHFSAATDTAPAPARTASASGRRPQLVLSYHPLSLSRTLSRGTRSPDERLMGGTCRHVARGPSWRALLTITRGADERSRAAHRHSANGITEARALTR